MNLAEARALALAAQGFGARPKTVDQAMLRALVEKLGVVQIDSVNVLARSHYLPAFARLGTYDRDALDALAWEAPRALFEYWAHEASLVPVELQPLFRFRMANAHKEAWGRVRRMAKNKQFVADVLAVITERGPIAASEIDMGEKKPKRKKQAGWWSWSKVKVAVEFLFWSGQITSAHRKGFERHYTTWENVVPKEILDAKTPSPIDAKRQLIERAARAMGIGTEADLRDYYRLDVADSRKAIADLVDAGTLIEEEVEGWKSAYRHRDAVTAPVDPTRAALLSPFDNLIWMRDRTDRLFDMKFRLEIYTPAHKRVHGYYVLPFLLGDRLVARIDLKADRKSGSLLVHATHGEPKIKKAEVAVHLATELHRMAHWLGLSQVHAAKSGDLATALTAQLKKRDRS
ncbi:MAG: crosslink repair DNA glycosylase YcaQ family protein [Kofleriaceae bacterium]